MSIEFTDAELEAYLDESLDSLRAGEIEQQLRGDKPLLDRLSKINGRRDAGMHTLGEIWRRNQVGVPTPEEIQKYLTGQLTAEHGDYIDFRIEVLKCPYTIALKHDAESRTPTADEKSQVRRKKYYQSSAGLLKKKPSTEF